jgi:hypothetical protein
VTTCLMDDNSVLEGMNGPDGILAGMRRGAIHIGTSTICPSASTQLAGLHAAQGSHYVAASVWAELTLPRQANSSPSGPEGQRRSSAAVLSSRLHGKDNSHGR